MLQSSNSSQSQLTEKTYQLVVLTSKSGRLVKYGIEQVHVFNKDSEPDISN